MTSLINVLKLFFLLVLGHCLGDFGLQHHQFAMGKNRNNDPPGYDPELHGPKQTVWPYYLTAHAAVHALIVFVITQSYIWAIYELVGHWIIDFFKTSKWTSVHEDQAMHIGMKAMIVWVMFILWTQP